MVYIDKVTTRCCVVFLIFVNIVSKWQHPVNIDKATIGIIYGKITMLFMLVFLSHSKTFSSFKFIWFENWYGTFKLKQCFMIKSLPANLLKSYSENEQISDETLTH